MNFRSRIGRNVLRNAAVTVALAVALAVFINHSRRKIDPVVRGQRLSAAVTKLLYIGRNNVEWAETATVITEIGTNAFPFLLRELTAKETRIETWKRRHKVPYLTGPSVRHRKIAACRAIRILGVQAKPLERYVVAFDKEFGGRMVAPVTEALAAMNPNDALALMTNSLELSFLPVDFRFRATSFALQSGADPAAIMRVLLTNCTRTPATGSQIRSFAEDLNKLPIKRSAVERSLITAAESNNVEARRMVAILLPACFPESEKTPVILHALERDTNSSVAFAARTAKRLWQKR